MLSKDWMGNPWFENGAIVGSRAVEALVACHQDFQIYRFKDKAKGLAVSQAQYDSWREIFPGDLSTQLYREFFTRTSSFGERQVATVDVGRPLEHMGKNLPPKSSADVTAILDAYSKTRTHYKGSLEDAVWFSSLGLLLPTLTEASTESRPTMEEDDVLVASWLTGGVPISLAALKLVTARADFLRGATALALQRFPPPIEETVQAIPQTPFALPGRSELARELDRMLVRPKRNAASYTRFGLSQANAVLLVGPPGTGKTFAVQEFANYLSAAIYEIRPNRVGSAYIHETSMLISNLFDEARASAAEGLNVIVFLDEAESYLGHRARDESSRREEAGELLRRLNQCGQDGIIVIGATNKPELIDPAFLRAGRFESIIKVDHATQDEIADVLDHLLSGYIDESVHIGKLSHRLADRSLADVDHVCRASKRLAAERDALKIARTDLDLAIDQLPSDVAAIRATGTKKSDGSFSKKFMEAWQALHGQNGGRR